MRAASQRHTSFRCSQSGGLNLSGHCCSGTLLIRVKRCYREKVPVPVQASSNGSVPSLEKVCLAEECSSEVGSVEVSSAEVRLYLQVLDPPRIPGSRTLFEQFEMAGACHRVHPRTAASMPWLQSESCVGKTSAVQRNADHTSKARQDWYQYAESGESNHCTVY